MLNKGKRGGKRRCDIRRIPVENEFKKDEESEDDVFSMNQLKPMVTFGKYSTYF